MVNAYAMRPAWTPLTIALMVIGFIVFWPLGLLMLAYIVWGHRVPDLRRHFEGMKQEFRSDFRERSRGCGSRGFTRSGNVAFDEYRERELKRLEEERRISDTEEAPMEPLVGVDQPACAVPLDLVVKRARIRRGGEVERIPHRLQATPEQLRRRRSPRPDRTIADGIHSRLIHAPQLLIRTNRAGDSIVTIDHVDGG